MKQYILYVFLVFGVVFTSSAQRRQKQTPMTMAERAVLAHQESIVKISREVWANAELSLEETSSAAVHIRELEAAGFKIVSKGTAGVPTSFVAEWTQGTGGPKIGFLAEYDALPGLGNVAEPRQAPVPNAPNSNGHGCGHNMLGAGCTGGAMALKTTMEQNNIAGTVRLYGCAAEETEGAKVYMAREGLFDDLDAALAWHPAPVAAAGLVRTSAKNDVKITFRGRTAHAGETPWEGRSALKAAELFGIGIQMMREHILPTARVHYVYESAGSAPNVVPDEARIWIVIRDEDREKVARMTDWVRQIAEGAALATQTQSEFDQFFGMYDLLPNEPLARLLHGLMQQKGIEWTPDEQAFAVATQKAMGLPENGMMTQVLPFIPAKTTGGSTDVGDLSYLTPTAAFMWPTFPLGVSLHTWPVTAAGGMSIGDKTSLSSAQILAAAGYELLTNEKLRNEAKADFLKRKGNTVYVSPLPPDRKKPLDLPDFMRQNALSEYLNGYLENQ